MFDDGGVVIENLIRIRLRAPRTRNTTHCEQILGGVGNTMERSAVMAPLNFTVGGFGLLQRNVRSQPRVRIEAGAKLLAAIQKHLREIDRQKLFRLDALRQFAKRQKMEFFGGHLRSHWTRQMVGCE